MSKADDFLGLSEKQVNFLTRSLAKKIIDLSKCKNSAPIAKTVEQQKESEKRKNEPNCTASNKEATHESPVRLSKKRRSSCSNFFDLTQLKKKAPQLSFADATHEEEQKTGKELEARRIQLI